MVYFFAFISRVQ